MASVIRDSKGQVPVTSRTGVAAAASPTFMGEEEFGRECSQTLALNSLLWTSIKITTNEAARRRQRVETQYGSLRLLVPYMRGRQYI
eukprot:6174677-Pleurochrysis_carterae.AAC.1